MAVLIGEGCKLYYGAETATTLLGQRTTMTGPSSSVAEVETTNLDSTAKEYRPGLFESGTATCEYEFDSENASHTGIETAMAARTILKWKLEFSNGATRSWEGFITGHEISGMTVEGNVLATINIRITTGSITPAAAPSGD
jgi:hypothetical protein